MYLIIYIHINMYFYFYFYVLFLQYIFISDKKYLKYIFKKFPDFESNL